MWKLEKKKVPLILRSAESGGIIPLMDVQDEVAFMKVLDDEFAVVFHGTEVASPCDGKMVGMYPIKHVIGLRGIDLELIIHQGLDIRSLTERRISDVCTIKGLCQTEGQLGRWFLAILEGMVNTLTTMVVSTDGAVPKAFPYASDVKAGDAVAAAF